MIFDFLDFIFGLVTIVLIVLSIWNGFTYEIGTPGDDYHLKFYICPLKRFFKKQEHA
jgi:archaellum biogenesis protein FlaJ (TadC family)